MNTSPRELEQIAAQVRRAKQYAGFAELAADTDASRAEKCATLAGEAAQAALTGLAALGVRAPVAGVVPVPPSVPLALLDTPASRRFLAALDAAAAAAADLDRERGAVDSHGDTIGASETLRAWAALVRQETFGPQGLD